MMSEHVIINRAESIMSLVLNRPDKKNALTDAMYKTLADAIEAAQDDAAVRVILIRSEGDMFCAGNDVGEFAAVAAGGSGSGNVTRFIHALADNAKPLVAAVQGRAVGIGTTMLLHCDHVVLAQDAQLSTPFVNLALVPEGASSLLLPALIGHVRAFSMFALGEPIPAFEAVAWGLANTCLPSSEIREAAERFAARLTRQPVGSLIATKQLLRDAALLRTRMDMEGRQFAARLTSPEALEAFTAFAQRRTPDFSRFG